MQASNDSFTDINVGTIAVTPVDCVKASSGPGDMNHFELRIAQGGIDVYATDAGTLAPLKKNRDDRPGTMSASTARCWRAIWPLMFRIAWIR